MRDPILNPISAQRPLMRIQCTFFTNIYCKSAVGEKKYLHCILKRRRRDRVTIIPLLNRDRVPGGFEGVVGLYL